MKAITLEQFKGLKPCWLEDEEKAVKLEVIGARKKEWTALDVLSLPVEEVSAEDKLWAVLRPEFIEERILHEFACRCADRALNKIESPDLRIVAVIEAKRKWLCGKITNKELDSALKFARAVVRSIARDFARAAVYNFAISAALAAAMTSARDAAWNASRAAAWNAAWNAAWDATKNAARAAVWNTARQNERQAQIQLLQEMLEG